MTQYNARSYHCIELSSVVSFRMFNDTNGIGDIYSPESGFGDFFPSSLPLRPPIAPV